MNIIEQSGYDPTEFHLGRLCKRGHDFAGTGQSLRHATNHCAQCRVERKAKVLSGLRETTKERREETAKRKLAEQDRLASDLKSMGVKDFHRYTLGRLCPGSHEFLSTGKSLRVKAGGECPTCVQARNKRDWTENKDRRSAQKREYHQRPQSQQRAKERYCANRESKEWIESRKNYLRQYYARNRDRMLLGFKEQRASLMSTKEGRQKKRDADLRWRENHRESERTRLKLFRQDNPNKSRSYSHRRRAKKRMAHSFACTESDLRLRLNDFGGSCVYCGKQHEQWDHFLPISLGGSDVIGNLVPSCASCNRSKNNRDPKSWYEDQRFYSAKKWEKLLRSLGKREGSYLQIPLL